MGPTLTTEELVAWAPSRGLSFADACQLAAVFEERDELRTALVAEKARADRAEAKIERIRNKCEDHFGERTACGQCYDSILSHLKSTRATVATLRAALEACSDGHDSDCRSVIHDNRACNCGPGIARAALSATNPEERALCDCHNPPFPLSTHVTEPARPTTPAREALKPCIAHDWCDSESSGWYCLSCGAVHSATPAAEPVEREGWRTGRKVGRTLYLDGSLVGLMDTPELAAKVVGALNAVSARPSPKDGR